jgi:hypothetical protein
MRMVLGDLADHRPWAARTQHLHPHARMKPPPSRGRLHPLALLGGKRCRRLCEPWAAAVCHGRIDQHTDGHPHQQRHAPLGLLQRPRGGETRRGLQQAAAACRLPLALIAWPHLVWRPWGVGERMRGQEKTTLLVDAGVSGREREGPGAVEPVDPLGGASGWAGASPCARAGRGAPWAGPQHWGGPVPLAGRPRLPRLGCARTGGRA